MSMFLARHWILHDHLFANRHMKENSSVTTNCLLQSRIDPTVHVMARIPWTIECGVDQSSQDPFVLFVLEPCLDIGWERSWVEQGVGAAVTAMAGAGADLMAVVTACAAAVTMSAGVAGAGPGATAGAAAAGAAGAGGAAGAVGAAKPAAESATSVPHCGQFDPGQKCDACRPMVIFNSCVKLQATACCMASLRVASARHQSVHQWPVEIEKEHLANEGAMDPGSVVSTAFGSSSH